jgi:hypothetical protein
MRTREENKDNFDVWYGNHRYRTKDLKEYVIFLKHLLDEILYYLAYVCRDIRRLEGRE